MQVIKGFGAAREAPHSLMPIQIDNSSLDRELASIKRGEGGRVLLALIAAALVMVGSLQWLKSSDGRRAYAAAAERLDDLRVEHSPAFQRCGLQDAQHPAQAPRSSIERASEQQKKAYATQLARCSEALVIMERELSALHAPLRMQSRIDTLQDLASTLTRALGSYRSYLQDPNRSYDSATAAPMIDKLALAYFDFQDYYRNTVIALSSGNPPRQ